MKRTELQRGSKPLARRTPLRADPDAMRAFVQRGRRSSTRTMATARPISPASTEQRRKVRYAMCVNCGGLPCDPAHLTPRSVGGCDAADCVIALCRECHRGLDERSGPMAGIDLAPVLALPEFAAERAHMAGHMSFPLCMRRLTGERS